MKTAVVALFNNYVDAEHAVDQLADAGIPRDGISIMSKEQREGTQHPASEPGTGPLIGAGAAIGGITGAVLGLTAIVVPGIGPLIAAGPLAAAFATATAGAAAGGVLGALTGMGMDERDANYYADGVRNGRALVAVQTDAEHVIKAREVVLALNPIEIRAPGLGDLPAGTTQPDYAPEDDILRAQGAYGEPPEGPEKTAAGLQVAAPINEKYESSFDEFAGIFRRHYSTFLADRGQNYEYYRPAYEFGYDMAKEDRFASCHWAQTESDVRREWERGKKGDWDKLKDAVKAGWDAAKGEG